jgi:hypothetical protein
LGGSPFPGRRLRFNGQRARRADRSDGAPIPRLTVELIGLTLSCSMSEVFVAAFRLERLASLGRLIDA